MHEAVRAWVRDHVSPVVAQNIPILYGGACLLRCAIAACTLLLKCGASVLMCCRLGVYGQLRAHRGAC